MRILSSRIIRIFPSLPSPVIRLGDPIFKKDLKIDNQGTGKEEVKAKEKG